ncbi:MAG: hypothetical protein D6706_02410 [Chloroflexi bacterium]|nr:MAG: hypothetical protein D6706_02410 [Chloroflexota bacterium]
MDVKALADLHEELRVCRLCLVKGFAIVPGAVFRGKAGARVMVVGQAPGVTEVEAKRPFNAGSGRRLFQWLEAAGWQEEQFRAEQYMTAVTKCYPGRSKNGKGDRVPSRAEQRLCRPFLDRELAIIRPKLLILVGRLAIQLVYPARLRLDEIIGTAVYFPPASLANPANLTWEAGECLTRFEPERSPNGRWVVPLPHPSGASLWPNKPQNQVLITHAIDLLRQIREAWGL